MRLIDKDALMYAVMAQGVVDKSVAKRLIIQAPTVEQWISVKERLPEKSGNYLVSGKWRSEPREMWICEFMKGEFVSGWMNHVLNPVVDAWMPLPKPWNGERKDDAAD